MPEQPLGKDALLDAAAVLFDEVGIDAVSLNAINTASGHKNRSAASYHFGGKDDVIRAVVERSMVGPNARRNELLDELERTDPSPSGRAVFAVMVAPMSDALATLAGRRHLRLLGQLVGHPRYISATQDVMWGNPSLSRCAVHLIRVVSFLPPALRQERAALLGAFIVRAYADQARLLDGNPPARPPLSTATFTTHLVDLLMTMVSAPTSAVVSDDPPGPNDPI